MTVTVYPGAPTRRQAAALRLRQRGLSYSAIGRELGTTRSEACHLVARARALLAEKPKVYTGYFWGAE